MSSFDIDCDLDTGAFRNPTKFLAVGYVLDFNIFEKLDLVADLTCLAQYEGSIQYGAVGSKWDPTARSMQAVGILTHVNLSAKPGGPLTFQCYVSADNAKKLIDSKIQPLTKNAVRKFTYVIFDYDTQLKKWYEKSHPLGQGAGGTDGILKGQFETSGSQVQMEIEDTGQPIAGLKNVRLHGMHASIITGGDSIYSLKYCSGPTNNHAVQWGIGIVGNKNSVA